MRDFKRLQEDPPEGVSGAPGENNIMVWNAVIFGPHETPFEDGTFKLMVSHFFVSLLCDTTTDFHFFRWSSVRSTPIAHQGSSSCQKCSIRTFTPMEESVSIFSETSRSFFGSPKVYGGTKENRRCHVKNYICDGICRACPSINFLR